MDIFVNDHDGIDPTLVPTQVLYTGARIPVIGLGTFGSDRYSSEQVADAVSGAIRVGYRHIDCASVYGNEAEIGKAFQAAFVGKLKREDLWVTSKVWNNRHGPGDILFSCAQSLRDLRLDYLDLYLVHWPFPNFHPPGCDVNSRSKNAQAYIHESYMKTWRQMERLVAMGLVRHIGTSNMTVPKLKLVLRDATVKPACNEMELHPHFQQPELFQFCIDHQIQPIGYCPVGSPNRPERDRTSEDTSPIEDPAIVKIAQDHHVHPAVICLKWAVQRGQIPIPFSVKRINYLSNMQGIVSEPLTAEEMNAIQNIDKNCRLIKGQVFLWKSDQSWEDLWDIHGEITRP
jgi:diketogulonate reductase-like aldo/keto reductase